MASSKERFVGEFEFTIRGARHRNRPVPLSISDFAAIEKWLHDRRSKGEFVRSELVEGRLYINLDDMMIDEKRRLIVFLFTVVDADAADAIYRHMKNGKLRAANKLPDEGGAVSVHLILDLRKEGTPRYSAYLEDMEGASQSRIIPFLQEVFRTVHGSVQVDVDEEVHEAPPVVEMQTRQGDRLRDAAGRPLSVKLVQLGKRKTVDPSSDDAYYEMNRSIEFSIRRRTTAQRAIEAVVNIRSRQQDEFSDYPLMRIQWRREDNRTQTLSVDSVADDLLQKAFTRLTLITGFRNLPMACAVINSEFVEKVVAQMSKKGTG